MRLNYMRVGDNFRDDEYNAVASILLMNNTVFRETIKLAPNGFTGKYATYYFSYDEDNIAFRESDLQILTNTGVCKIHCVSDLKAVFSIVFNGDTYISNTEQVIVIDLSNYTGGLDTIVNEFSVSVEYVTPFISDKPQAPSITTTSELKEIIQTLEPNESISLGNDLVHNLRKPILIDKDVVINMNGHKIISSRKTGSLFSIDNNYKLTINNGVFNNFKADNGAVFYNKGILIINDTVFNNCTALNNGAVCYNEYGEAYFSNTSFNNCDASNGGAVYNRGDEL